MGVGEVRSHGRRLLAYLKDTTPQRRLVPWSLVAVLAAAEIADTQQAQQPSGEPAIISDVTYTQPQTIVLHDENGYVATVQHLPATCTVDIRTSQEQIFERAEAENAQALCSLYTKDQVVFLAKDRSELRPARIVNWSYHDSVERIRLETVRDSVYATPLQQKALSVGTTRAIEDNEQPPDSVQHYTIPLDITKKRP